MGRAWLFAAVCLASVGAVAAETPGEPLRFRWPLPAEATVTQATIDGYGNFSYEYKITATPVGEGKTVRISASDYRLLYLNGTLLTGWRLDAFDMLGILHRLTVPSFVVDAQGGLLRTEPPDPQQIETAFLSNVSSARAASLRQWFVERRPGDFQAVRERSTAYWQSQVSYWAYWAGKWRALFGSPPADLERRQPLHLAGLRVTGRTRLIGRAPVSDCAACVAVAAEDRFTREDLAPHMDALAQRFGLTRSPGEAAMTGMRAYVRMEAVIDWRTMLPYRVQAMTIAFQDLADGRTVNIDQTKDFHFEWQHVAAGRGKP